MVHGKFEGDTYFPKVDSKIWTSLKREDHMPDAKNEHAYSFIDYERK
ncbi:dihydrofolate reductase [Ancylomarina sp.]